LSDSNPSAIPVGRRERRKQEVRARLYEAARRLFNQQGFDATTVEQIAEAADCAPATFFNHFQNKQTVLRMMTSGVVSHLQEMLEAEFEHTDSAEQRLVGLATTAANQIAQHHDIARHVMLELVRTRGRPEAQTPYLDQIFEPVEGVLSEGQSNGEVRDDHDARFLTRMVVGMLNTAVTHWLADPSYPIEQELPRAARFAWDAVRARSD
jgi:AcrR family transcriptional regulator